jgi:hypothetical protein
LLLLLFVFKQRVFSGQYFLSLSASSVVGSGKIWLCLSQQFSAKNDVTSWPNGGELYWRNSFSVSERNLILSKINQKVVPAMLNSTSNYFVCFLCFALIFFFPDFLLNPLDFCSTSGDLKRFEEEEEKYVRLILKSNVFFFYFFFVLFDLNLYHSKLLRCHSSMSIVGFEQCIRFESRKTSNSNLFFCFSVYPSAGLWFANLGTVDALTVAAQLTVASVSSCGDLPIFFFLFVFSFESHFFFFG